MKIKNIMSSFVLLVLLVGCFGMKKDQIEDITISSYRVDCQGFIPQKCFVQIMPDNSKQLFYEEIIGFTFEPGYKYQLRLRKTPRCNVNDLSSCPQDIGLYEYSLEKILNKIAYKDQPE